jgi:hypothetical protein
MKIEGLENEKTMIFKQNEQTLFMYRDLKAKSEEEVTFYKFYL